MIFSAPGATAADERVLGLIEQRREELRFYLHRPWRWYGTLRRVTEARAITAASVTRDLAAMVNAGLLVPSGEKRGRSYHGTEVLRSLWQEIRRVRLVDTAEDPYRSE